MKQDIQAWRLLAALLLFLTACQETRRKPSTRQQSTENGFNLDPRFNQTDSMVISFYNDPYGEDSLHYTRYYTQASLVDKAAISTLKEQLSAPFIQQSYRRYCRGEGKIWCYNKGKIFQTLYFSTLCDACCFVYLIKEGNFYYSSMNGEFGDWLLRMKKISKEPGTNAGK